MNLGENIRVAQYRLFTIWRCSFCLRTICHSTFGRVGSVEIAWEAEMGGVRDTKYKHVFEQERVTEKKINRKDRMYIE